MKTMLFPESVSVYFELGSRLSLIQADASVPPVYGRKNFVEVAAEAPDDLKRAYLLWHTLVLDVERAKHAFTEYTKRGVPIDVKHIPQEVRDTLAETQLHLQFATSVLRMMLWQLYPQVRQHFCDPDPGRVYFEGWRVGYEECTDVVGCQEA